MTSKTFIGIDPGLVHTGMVFMTVLHLPTLPRASVNTTIDIEYKIISGDDHGRQALLLATPASHVYIEAYRERGQMYAQNKQMLERMQEFRTMFPAAKIVDNTGSKQVLRREALKKLKLLKFPATNHQDLQAAARILIYGMLKDPEHNALLYQIFTRPIFPDVLAPSERVEQW